MEYRYWATTDVGRKRKNNEDNFLIDKDLNLFVVADGMGGHASGEIASAMAVYTIRDLVFENRDMLESFTPDNPLHQMEVCTLLEHAVHTACANVWAKAQREPEKKGMGTTVVALMLIGDRGFIAYVGDSRIYLLREGTVYPLTEDHSLMNELIRSGQVRAEEFHQSPFARYKNAMTRAVGVHEKVDVDVLDFDLVSDDAFLLCSDGLYEYLDDSDIATTLVLPEIEEIPRRFIDLANSRGGKDNITALVVRVRDQGKQRRAGARGGLSVESLRRLPLMRQLSYGQLSRVLSVASLRAFKPGELLAEEGEEGGELGMVLEGQVALALDGASIRTIDPGDFFGEMDLTERSRRTMTATALTEGQLLTIPREQLHTMLQNDSRPSKRTTITFPPSCCGTSATRSAPACRRRRASSRPSAARSRRPPRSRSARSSRSPTPTSSPRSPRSPTTTSCSRMRTPRSSA